MFSGLQKTLMNALMEFINQWGAGILWLATRLDARDAGCCCSGGERLKCLITLTILTASIWWDWSETTGRMKALVQWSISPGEWRPQSGQIKLETWFSWLADWFQCGTPVWVVLLNIDFGSTWSNSRPMSLMMSPDKEGDWFPLLRAKRWWYLEFCPKTTTKKIRRSNFFFLHYSSCLTG